MVDDVASSSAGTKKRSRSDSDSAENSRAIRQRLHLLHCPMPGNVELDHKLQLAKEKYKSKSPRCYSAPDPGVASVSNILHASDTQGESEIVYSPTSSGVGLRRVFLCDTSRKRTVVHDYAEAVKFPGMKSAMELEIETFKRFGVLEETLLTNLPQDTNLISTRWVLSTKTNPDGSKKCKARLVARGFEDSEKENISRDSPVASNATQRLVLQLLAEKQWIPQSFDFLSAFLQGKLLERIVAIAPPLEFGIPEGMVWVIKKPIYGLCSAFGPKAWYDALLDVCTAEGFDTHVSDEGILRLLDRSGVLVGVLALHVDDCIGGGTDALSAVMKKVGEKLQIGSHESAATEKGFFYKGLRVSVVHHESGSLSGKFEILLDGNDYLNSVLKMPEPAGEDERLLDASESKDFRSVAGCIGYMASAFRCDLAVETSMLGRSFFAPTVWSAKKANAAIDFAKENKYVLSFRPGAENC